LTTAEALVVEAIVLAHISGSPHWTIERERWVRPQLEELAERGLVVWEFDDDANFRVTPTQVLVDGDEYQRVYMKCSNTHFRETA
jgi:hypothetical protein